MQNTYNLSELLDLALRVPEIGAVNFNILYIVLKTTISELGLKEVKPWCHIENPVTSKAALTQAKLNSKQQISKSVIPLPAKRLDPLPEAPESTSDDEALPPDKAKQKHAAATEKENVEGESKESQITSKDQEHKISGKDFATKSAISKSKDASEKIPARKASASEVEKRESHPASATEVTERVTLESKPTSKQEQTDRKGFSSEVQKEETGLETPSKLETSKTKDSSEKGIKNIVSAPEVEKQDSLSALTDDQATSESEDTPLQKPMEKEIFASKVQKQEKPSKQTTSKSKDISKKNLLDAASDPEIEEQESPAASIAKQATSEIEDIPKQKPTDEEVFASEVQKQDKSSKQTTSKSKDISKKDLEDTTSAPEEEKQKSPSAPTAEQTASKSDDTPKQKPTDKEVFASEVQKKDKPSKQTTSKSKDISRKDLTYLASASEAEKQKSPSAPTGEQATSESEDTPKQKPTDKKIFASEVQREDKPSKQTTSKSKDISKKDLADTASAPEVKKPKTTSAPTDEQTTSESKDTPKQKPTDTEVQTQEKSSKQTTSRSEEISKKDLSDAVSAPDVRKQELLSAPTAEKAISEGVDSPKQEIAVKDTPSKVKKQDTHLASEIERPTSKGKDTLEQKQAKTSATSGRQDISSTPRSKGETSEDKKIPEQERKSKKDPEISKPPRKKFSRGGADLEEASKQLKAQKDSFTEIEDKRKRPRDRNVAQNWHFVNLESRVGAAEEGIMRLTDIVDIISDKLRKRESQKRPGGPTALELEEFDDRITSLEEAREECENDHKKSYYTRCIHKVSRLIIS